MGAGAAAGTLLVGMVSVAASAPSAPEVVTASAPSVSGFADHTDPGEKPDPINGPVAGLPPLKRHTNHVGLEAPGNWTQVMVNSKSEVKAAKQWFNLPEVYFMVDAAAYTVADPRYDIANVSFSNVIYVRSPRSAPEPYGYWPDATVRTVAFGVIPVEATVRISMQRDQDNLPIGWEFPFIELLDPDAPGYANANTQRIRSGGEIITTYPIFTPAEVTGKVEVQILDAKVDGVPLKVGANCRTARPATVSIPLPKMYSKWVGLPPEGVYGPVMGGPMAGEIKVPEFADCGVGGDDLDPLLTRLISGDDNGLRATQGYLANCGWSTPVPPPCEPADIPMPSKENPDPFVYPPDIGEW